MFRHLFMQIQSTRSPLQAASMPQPARKWPKPDLPQSEQKKPLHITAERSIVASITLPSSDMTLGKHIAYKASVVIAIFNMDANNTMFELV